jgi:hypothetical protein
MDDPCNSTLYEWLLKIPATIGFKLTRETPPNFWYVVKGIRKHRSGFTRHKLLKDGIDPNNLEHNKIYNIYDRIIKI